MRLIAAQPMRPKQRIWIELKLGSPDWKSLTKALAKTLAAFSPALLPGEVKSMMKAPLTRVPASVQVDDFEAKPLSAWLEKDVHGHVDHCTACP